MSLLLFYVFVDTGIYNTYQYHFNGFFIAMLLGGGGGEIFQFSTTEWWFAGLLVFAIFSVETLLLMWLWRRRLCAASGSQSAASKSSNSKRRFAVLPAFVPVMVLGCYITSHMINAWGYANFIPSIVSRSNTLPFYFGMTAQGFLMRHHMISDAGLQKAHEQRQFTVNQHNFHYPLKPIHISQAKSKHMNIVFLMIDTWRADNMNPKASPAIYAFAQRNLQFTQHWSGGNCTQPGIFSLFYSIPATYFQAALGEHTPSILVSTLQQQGYNMFVHMSAELTVSPFNATVFASVHPLQLQTPGASPWQRDEAINNYTIDFLHQQAKLQRQNPQAHPFFAWAFYDAVHGDSYPSDYKLRFKPVWQHVNRIELNRNTNRTPYYNIYKNAVTFDDGLIGQVLTTLKQEHLLKNTLVLISSDHGQAFNDYHHNFWGHSSVFTPAETHVPLIVHWPGKAAHTYTHYTSHFDIVPTIMSQLLGVTNPYADYSVGKSLFAQKDWPFLVVTNYQRMGVIEHQRLTTFYKAGYLKKTKPNLEPINTPMSAQRMRQVLAQIKRFS